MTSPPLPDKVVAVDRALEKARLAHAFGGALALAYYAEPRATIDVDVNLFFGVERLAAVRAALAPLGVAGEGDDPRVARDGQCRWWWDRTPLDLFFAYDALHEAMPKEVRRVPFGEDRIPILGPEHLIVCKAVFDRAKDWLDIEQILVSIDRLDSAEIDRWLDEIVGRDDPRAQRFDRLVAELRDG